MEHYSHPPGLPVSEMHMKMVGQVSSNPETHHFYAPMPISSNTMSNTSMTPNNVGHNESCGGSIGSSPIYMPDQLGSKDASMMNNMADEKPQLPVKRKSEMGPLINNSVSQQSLLHNKRPAHVGANVNPVGFLQPSAPQRKTAPSQSKLGSPAQHSQNKKMVRNDSVSGKSGLQRGQSAKKQTAQVESASKVRPESSEAVRSKMRESLAGALALAFRKDDDVSNTEKNQIEATIAHQPIDSRASEPNLTMGRHVPVSGSETSKDDQGFSAELLTNGSSGRQAFQGFQYTSILSEDVSFGDNFFAKDDLLQGNGLSWAFDFDAQMGEGKDAQPAEKPKPVKEEVEARGCGKEVAVLTPENLAFDIEAELFKLFGDVNKKYREKGRSLLFNLKDRNNPDLRERVMSGELSPERLCSMSAEELASKELSQWRTAKAEELAQMVVLPDAEVDVRRLVKKTHKGEYQVEIVDHDDGIASEVSSGTFMSTQTQPKQESEPHHSPSKSSLEDKERDVGQGSSLEDQDLSGSLIIPTDGTDLMQGMIVDELKDAEFLPPIVSLDEFMESLDNEPPFENLSGDAGQRTSMPLGESPKLVRNSRASNQASDSPKDASSKKAGVFRKQNLTVKSSGSPAKQKDILSTVPKVEYMWDGTLQLNISSSVTVGGLYQSGEKTSLKYWPTSLEIKGRVRVDAFEKFIQELPMSRTRAVMVLQFVLKDTSSETQRANLSEAIDSYVIDERLGYAEPAPGVELYLCPPTPRISDSLKKLIPKENSETNNSIENGLIGVVVWRRAHISNTISPPSSSHHKHVPKKQPLVPPKRVQDSLDVNVSTPTRTPPPVFNNRAEPEKEDDDDIPPGFGPAAAARAAAKDDDDLPEFNFSGDLMLNPSIPRASPQNLNFGERMVQRPVDQVRELIKMYGQSGNSVSSRGRVDNVSIGIEPWKDDDDDDDIPEWRPQALPPLPPYAVAAQGHRPPVHFVSSNQHRGPMVTQQPPGGRWVQPHGPLRGPSPRWRQY